MLNYYLKHTARTNLEFKKQHFKKTTIYFACRKQLSKIPFQCADKSAYTKQWASKVLLHAPSLYQ